MKERGAGPKDWSPFSHLEPKAIFDKLADIAPDIAFTVDWEEDRYLVWDGEGPDPVEDGFVAYDVDVKASTVAKGVLLEETKSLGGVYAKPEEQDPDVHGYLPQMLEEACVDLLERVSGSQKRQLQTAVGYLKSIMRQRHKVRR